MWAFSWFSPPDLGYVIYRFPFTESPQFHCKNVTSGTYFQYVQLSQAEKAKLIEDVRYYDGGSHVTIRDLTPAGHEFLANIRNDSIWKKVISKAPDASLLVLFELAKDFAVKYFLG